jgi:hypothetical protein
MRTEPTYTFHFETILSRRCINLFNIDYTTYSNYIDPL